MDENTLASPHWRFGRSSFLALDLFFYFISRFPSLWTASFSPTLCYPGHVTTLKHAPIPLCLVYPNYSSSPLRLSQLILPIAVEGVAIMENAFLRTPAESLEHFKVSEQTGLSQNAVLKSRQQYGPNG